MTIEELLVQILKQLTILNSKVPSAGVEVPIAPPAAPPANAGAIGGAGSNVVQGAFGDTAQAERQTQVVNAAAGLTGAKTPEEIAALRTVLGQALVKLASKYRDEGYALFNKYGIKAVGELATDKYPALLADAEAKFAEMEAKAAAVAAQGGTAQGPAV